MNGNPLQRIKAGESEARDAWFSQCGKMLIQGGFLTREPVAAAEEMTETFALSAG